MDMHILDLREQKTDIKQKCKAMLFEIASYRSRGGRILKIMHSTEKSLTASIHRDLRKLKQEKRLVCYIPSEKYHTGTPEVLYIIDKLPWVAEDKDLGAGPDLFTVVFLG